MSLDLKRFPLNLELRVNSLTLDRKETPWFVRYMRWFNFIYIYVLCVHTYVCD